MITAEMQRVLLLVALAATAYLLILAWNDDYIKGRAVPGGSSGPVATAPLAETPDNFAEARDESDTKNSSTAATSQQTPVTRETASGDATDRIVKVVTDTMEVWVDRLGGDIVRVQLPRYPVSIDKPKEPFLLLDRRADHVYIAQSGLAGRDGVDVGGRRPLYETAHNEFDFRNGGVMRLTTTENGVEIAKVFTFTPDDYVVTVGYDVINRTDHPFEVRQFAQLKRDSRDLATSSTYTLSSRPYLGAT